MFKRYVGAFLVAGVLAVGVVKPTFVCGWCECHWYYIECWIF